MPTASHVSPEVRASSLPSSSSPRSLHTFTTPAFVPFARQHDQQREHEQPAQHPHYHHPYYHHAPHFMAPIPAAHPMEQYVASVQGDDTQSVGSGPPASVAPMYTPAMYPYNAQVYYPPPPPYGYVPAAAAYPPPHGATLPTAAAGHGVYGSIPGMVEARASGQHEAGAGEAPATQSAASSASSPSLASTPAAAGGHPRAPDQDIESMQYDEDGGRGPHHPALGVHPHSYPPPHAVAYAYPSSSPYVAYAPAPYHPAMHAGGYAPPPVHGYMYGPRFAPGYFAPLPPRSGDRDGSFGGRSSQGDDRDRDEAIVGGQSAGGRG